jgi:isoleucyl-tRNA synthetase
MVVLTRDKVEVRRAEKEGLKILNEGTLTLALDAEITAELLAEGYVRDLVRGVQGLRKEAGLEVTDRIKLVVAGEAELRSALGSFMDFVKSETLAVSVTWAVASDTVASDTIAGAGAAAPGSGGAFADIEAGDKTWRAEVAKA